jgi:hypothetical protein
MGLHIAIGPKTAREIADFGSCVWGSLEVAKAAYGDRPLPAPDYDAFNGMLGREAVKKIRPLLLNDFGMMYSYVERHWCKQLGQYLGDEVTLRTVRTMSYIKDVFVKILVLAEQHPNAKLSVYAG